MCVCVCAYVRVCLRACVPACGAPTEHPWSLWIWTTDIANSGTDADISFQIYGTRGKSDEIRLDNKSDNFEQGQLDKFMVCVRRTARSPPSPSPSATLTVL